MSNYQYIAEDVYFMNPYNMNDINNQDKTDRIHKFYQQPIDEQERLMNHIQQLTTEVINYNLYLDVFPEDREAITSFNTYNDRLKRATNQYEAKYGPITLDSPYLKDVPWQWLKAPWPWEKGRRA